MAGSTIYAYKASDRLLKEIFYEADFPIINFNLVTHFRSRIQSGRTDQTWLATAESHFERTGKTQSGGRIESILMSLPSEVSWRYKFDQNLNSEEQNLYNFISKKHRWI